jgi:hypothetical protein
MECTLRKKGAHLVLLITIIAQSISQVYAPGRIEVLVIKHRWLARRGTGGADASPNQV